MIEREKRKEKQLKITTQGKPISSNLLKRFENIAKDRP